MFPETQKEQVQNFANFCLQRKIDSTLWLESIRDEVTKSPMFEPMTYQERQSVLVATKDLDLWMRVIGDTVHWIRNENSLYALGVLHNLRLAHAEMDVAQKTSPAVEKAKGQLLRIIDQSLVYLRNYVSYLRS